MDDQRRRQILMMVLYVAGAAATFYFIRLSFQADRRTIPYSAFRTLVKEGLVADVVLGPDEIEGQLAPGKSLPAGLAIDAVAGGTFRTVPPPEDPELPALLERHGVEFIGKRDQGGVLPVLLSLVLPVLVFVVFLTWMMRRMSRGAQGGVLSVGKSRVKMVSQDDIGVTFADVAGVEEAKEELQEIVDFLRQPERYARIGARIPKGVLLFGPPGTGKTLLARAVAGEAHVPFFLISGSDFVEMFVGVGASRVRDLFEQAKKKAPCIIFIDELDALGKARGPGGLSGANDEREQTLNQLLVEMDGFDPNVGVIIMAATNRPETLDPALLRPGRFDRQVGVDPPDLHGREAILKVHAKNVKLADNVDLSVVARRTPGFAGADLANLVNEAALRAVRRDGERVTLHDFDDAIERLVAGLEKKGRIITPKEKRIVAYHELGHAIVAERVPGSDPVHSVSIVPRGMAALGFTWQRPTEDRYLLTRGELRDRIASLLGGRAAEEVVFQEISTGAQNDLARASDIARAMVRSYGMSERLGPVAYERQSRSRGLVQPPEACELGQAITDEIDREVRDIVDAELRRARDILSADRAPMEALADRLIREENLSGEDVRRALGLPERTSELRDPETAIVPAGTLPLTAGATDADGRDSGAPEDA
jgi:cell division protease FtsH